MLTMSQINHIKDLSNCGYCISEISQKTCTDPKTIRKYLSQDDFSPEPPITKEKPSKLDPFKTIIQEWLEEDKKHWRKQHHTAQGGGKFSIGEDNCLTAYRNGAFFIGCFKIFVCYA